MSVTKTRPIHHCSTDGCSRLAEYSISPSGRLASNGKCRECFEREAARENRVVVERGISRREFKRKIQCKD